MWPFAWVRCRFANLADIADINPEDFTGARGDMAWAWVLIKQPHSSGMSSRRSAKRTTSRQSSCRQSGFMPNTHTR